MDKQEAKIFISNKYNELLNGVCNITVAGSSYIFIGGTDIVSGLSFAKQVAIIKGLSTAIFKDGIGIHSIPLAEFDLLIASLILRGDALWSIKINKYSQIDLASTEEELIAIVESAWV